MSSQQKKIFDTNRSISDHFNENNTVILNNGDSLDFLRTIPSNTVSLIITSPPYNVGKSYETKQSLSKYLDYQKRVVSECVRILANNGSICWEIGNYIENKEVYPLDILFYPMFKEEGLKLKNRIIWHMGHGQHEKRRFSGRYETILWFTKNDDHIFNLDSVRVPNKYPGKRHYRGDKKGQPSCNPLGKNPSDFWEIVTNDWDKEIWEIPNVKCSHPEKTIHPCQYPIELVERCLLALTNENDWILDPFCGVGSALIAGLKHNRKVIGIDKETEYIEITKQRIQSYFEGTLKVRKLGTPIMAPNPKEKWSKIPEEWKEFEVINGKVNY